jgi:hypothetical protein
MNLRFRRPARGDITVDARIDQAEIARIRNEAETNGKDEYWLELQLLDADGEVVAESRGLYQMRAH